MLDIANSDSGCEQVMPGLERTHTAALLLCGVGQESSCSVFHTKFSDWTNKWNQVIAVQDVYPVPLAAVAMGVPLILLLFIAVLSLVLAGFNLRVEPILILGGKDG